MAVVPAELHSTKARPITAALKEALGAALPGERQSHPREDQQGGETGARQPRLAMVRKVERRKQHAARAKRMAVEAPQ